MSKSLGKIYTSGGGDTADWLYCLGFERARNLDEASVLALSGGSDISPQLYNEPVGSRTYSSPSRDAVEVDDFKRALKEKKKIIGICRGLQLICALSGGKLIQHVSNHHGTHMILHHTNLVVKDINAVPEGHNVHAKGMGTVRVNSIHHQMIYPYDLPKEDYDILGWTDKDISTVYLDGRDRQIALPNDFVEIEVCKFHKTNALGWQYHPEMMSETTSAAALEYTRNTFIKFYNDEI